MFPPHIPYNMANFCPLTGEIGSGVWGTPAKRVSRLGLVTAGTLLNGSQSNFARCLAVSWAGTLYSVSTKKRPPKYNGVVFEILGRHQ